VFGRVTPEDKLRLARSMQEQGLVVAMTGDAVNDAAALKQADIGVAMGSGSEVTKQAAVLFLAALTPLVVGPDEPSTDQASASMTMTFVVMGLGTVFNSLTNRRDPTSGLSAPILKALVIALFPVVMIFLATELPRFQKALLTVSLTGGQWLAAIGLALLLPIVIEVSKWTRRRRAPKATVIDVQHAVAPARAHTDATPVSSPH
jgi:Ca2+-transporting ATPase